MSLETYRSYKDLPPLAGLCSIARAAQPGLSVEECVRRLKRYHYAFKRLQEIFVARITAEPVMELKTAFSHHAYLCAEHVTAMRERVAEMREPPLGLDVVPDTHLELLFDEILASPTAGELLVGVYEVVLPALRDALGRHMTDTNPLADAPSVRVCKFAGIEVGEMLEFGTKAIESLVGADGKRAVAPWVALLTDAAGAAGGLDGTSAKPQAAKALERRYSGKPYQYDPVPKRDERFPDPYNMGVNAEVFLYDEKMPPLPKTLMMLYKRLRELDVPEMMASIIHQTRGKPWKYYRDMTRQLWDEARHAMMGEVGFARLGLDWPKLVPVNFTWSLGLNTQLEAWERHAVLFFIEQGLMPKTGKRFEWEVGVASQDPFAATVQDYDWADEVLHAKIGRELYVSQFKDAKEAIGFGDACWTKVLMGWESWREQGLTQHRNWWPELYREACKEWGVAPDPAVESFNTSYEKTRADLKDLAVSG
jgi:hypothetical protein